MAFVHVQAGENGLGVNGTSLTVTLSQPATAGNLITVSFLSQSLAISSITVTDNASIPNTYAQNPSTATTAFSDKLFQFYGVQVTGGATTITISWTTSTRIAAVCDEFSGGLSSNAAIFDTSKSGTGGSGTSSSVVSFAPASAGELIVASIAVDNGVVSPAAGTNYTLGETDTNNTHFTEYRLSGAASEIAPASWSGTSSWGEVVGAYIAAPSSGATQEFLMYNNVGMGR